MRSDLERLEDIKEAILQIRKYSIQGQEAFQNEELIQIWIVHYLQTYIPHFKQVTRLTSVKIYLLKLKQITNQKNLGLTTIKNKFLLIESLKITSTDEKSSQTLSKTHSIFYWVSLRT
jgi:hypothetical protein